MRAITFFALMVVTILILVALWQIPLVTDVVTATGYTSAEVFSGIAAVITVFYTGLFVLTYR